MSAPAASRYDLADAAHDYPAWQGPPRRSILICTHPRSGSTLLGEALHFAGGLGRPLEFLHAGSRPRFEAQWRVHGARALTDQAWARRTDPSGSFAAKLFWRDLAELAAELAPGRFPDLLDMPAADTPPATYRALGDLLGTLFPDPIHLHLERRDRLRQAVSSLTAVETGRWRHIPGIEEAEAGAAVAYDFDRIGAMIAAAGFCHAHWNGFFAANGIRPYRIGYEDLVADYRHAVQPLLAALGHDGAVPPVRMARQADARSEALMHRFLRDQHARRRSTA